MSAPVLYPNDLEDLHSMLQSILVLSACLPEDAWLGAIDWTEIL